MAQFIAILEALFILVALTATAVWLRKRGTISQREEGVFSRLMADFALPALIFTHLSAHPFGVEKLLMAVLLFGSIAVVMLVAWAIGRAMGLSRPALGSVILVAGFGSSSTLGYSLIHQVFGGDAAVMSLVVVMGEVGVIAPLFIIGTAIAMHFGSLGSEQVNLAAAARSYFVSPIFIALVLGVGVSWIDLPRENWFVVLFFSYVDIAADSLALLVAFNIGLMLRAIPLRNLARLVALVALLKLIVEPVVAGSVALVFGIPSLERGLLVFQAGMPSGAIAAVIAVRYGCDGAVASNLLLATYIIGLTTLPLIMFLSF